MALDTNLTPEVVNSYNTYINGNKAIGVTSEISMPTITSETIDVSGTGILGKISAPNIGQFESIEQEITFNLIYSSFVDALALIFAADIHGATNRQKVIVFSL